MKKTTTRVFCDVCDIETTENSAADHGLSIYRDVVLDVMIQVVQSSEPELPLSCVMGRPIEDLCIDCHDALAGVLVRHARGWKGER